MRKRLMRNPYLRLLAVLLLLLSLMACETLGYYGQAARGQLALLWNREPIERLLVRDDVPAALKSKLAIVLEIRQFAEQQLALPAGDSYLTYVDVGREHMVWNVFAAPEFSVEPLTWCYPIAGCVSYRGYFRPGPAERFATRLREDGYDVYLGGVDAYSTLGWFDDPLPSTVIDRRDYQLAALIFHELSHQLVYVPGDTVFNESFATTVEREGLRRWLEQQGDSQSGELARLEAARREQFVELVIDYRDRFAEAYSQESTEAQKRQRKQALQSAMRQDYAALKQSWGGIAAYDGWFAGELNNAQLSTVSSYNSQVPGFQRLLTLAGEDLPAFYAEVRRIAELDSEARNAALDVD